MKKSALFLFFIPFISFAEENENYTLILSGQEISYIGNVLSTRPYSEVAQLINKLQSQLTQQDNQAKKEAKDFKSDAEKYRKDHPKD